MKTFTMKMNGHQRPVIDLYGAEAIIDTGAIIPMTSYSPELVTLAWKATPKLLGTSIGGIGGESRGDVYTLYNFQVGDLIFDELDVFIPYEPDVTYSFLLSATMFHGMKIDFDLTVDENQSFIVNIPENVDLHRKFNVTDLKGKLCIQIDGILIQEDDKPYKRIDNYSQVDIADDFDGR